jgi:peptide/nickel transport system ATP-binding protein
MQIDQLKIYNDKIQLVDISFKIERSTALVGQSGSGKSLTLKALLGMLPKSLTHTIDTTGNFELTSQNVAYIPQNPFTSLSPLTKITKQFFCSYEKQLELIQLMNLDKNSLDKYPMQLSGGQLQRVIIAIALSTNPKLLLLDEPTTALDTKSKELVLNTLSKLKRELNVLMLFVTHDISSIKNICEDIIILKNGTIVEQGDIKSILYSPCEEYTKQLISSGFESRAFRI